MGARLSRRKRPKVKQDPLADNARPLTDAEISEAVVRLAVEHRAEALHDFLVRLQRKIGHPLAPLPATTPHESFDEYHAGRSDIIRCMPRLEPLPGIRIESPSPDTALLPPLRSCSVPALDDLATALVKTRSASSLHAPTRSWVTERRSLHEQLRCVLARPTSTRPALGCPDTANRQTDAARTLAVLLHAGVVDVADVRARTGRDLVYLAVVRANIPALAALLTAGRASPNMHSDGGKAPLHESCDDEATMRMLLAAGADLHAVDHFGRTPLHWAVFFGHAETASLLLDYGSNAEAVDHGGRTALIYAAHRSHEACALLLLTAGANVMHRDAEGMTAADHATHFGSQSTIAMLGSWLPEGVHLPLPPVRGDFARNAVRPAPRPPRLHGIGSPFRARWDGGAHVP